MENKKVNTKAIVGIGILTAIVVVLQFIASGIKFGPFSITLVLIPIVVGAALYGVKAGAWLGLVFGAVVLATDAGAFLAISIPGTVIVCLLKGILAGMASGFTFKFLEKKNIWLAVLSSAIVCPVVNTGVFLLGGMVFFFDTLKMWGESLGFESFGAYIVFGLVGLNFLVEAGINVLLSSAIVRVLDVVRKSKR